MDAAVPPRSELRILLAEDSPQLAERLQQLLDEPGVSRVEAVADTEAAAIAALQRGDWDVLILDVELRQGSGINVVRSARRTLSGRAAPLIIMLTNYALPVVRARSLEAGADHFLDKMKDFPQLLPLIRSRQRRAEHP